MYRGYRYRYLLDADEISFMISNLSRGDIAVDVGSHKGGYLYWMRRAVGHSGHCYAFEPQESLFDYLEQVVGHYPNVTLERLGLSNVAESKELYVPAEPGKSSPGATLEDHKYQDKEAQKFKIRTSTLDNYFLEGERLIPSLLKIDVEGHEFSVLKGGQELLSRYKPKLIIECEQRHLKTDITDVFRFIQSFDYQGFFFKDGKLIDINEFDPGIFQKQEGERFWAAKDYVNNFVFCCNLP